MSDDKRRQVGDTVSKIITKISVDTSGAKSMVASLRHSAGREIGEDPELFGLLIEDIPQELQGSGGSVSRAEHAIYTALVMFPAGPKNIRDRNYSIAYAAKTAGIQREKLMLVETADDITEMKHPLRALLQLIKAKGGMVDYGHLAIELYDWQFDKIKTARKWEREYASAGSKKEEDNKNEQ